jgi:cell division protein ZapA (FtsZ GTPase activity inhibitor)
VQETHDALRAQHDDLLYQFYALKSEHSSLTHAAQQSKARMASLESSNATLSIDMESIQKTMLFKEQLFSAMQAKVDDVEGSLQQRIHQHETDLNKQRNKVLSFVLSFCLF